MTTPLLISFLFAATCVFAAELKPISAANGPKPVGPYSPGIMSEHHVFVSGQGARDATGRLPMGIEEQTRQCLANVKSVLEAAGLTPEHVVWAQIFLTDMKALNTVDKVYASFFSKDPPARSLVAVARLPGENPIEIAVAAVRDLKVKKVINVGTPRTPASAGVQVRNRVYVSGILGMDANQAVPKDPQRQVQELIGQMRAVLKQGDLELRNLAYAHVYVDPGMPMKVLADLLREVLPSETALSVVQAVALPYGAHIEISGVASKDAKREGDCTGIGDVVYCPGVGGTIEQSLNRIKANLKIARSDISRVVVTNVYIDDIQHFDAMNKVYADAFGKWLPTRSTVQPTPKPEELNLAPSTNSPPPKRDSPRVQITVIGVR